MMIGHLLRISTCGIWSPDLSNLISNLIGHIGHISLSHVPPSEICNVLVARKDLYTISKSGMGPSQGSQNTAELGKARIMVPIKVSEG